MKNLLIVIVSLGVLILGILGIKVLTGQKPQQAALSIDSIPKSTVFIDGKHVGQTPFYDEKLKAGDYIVKLMPETEATKASSWSTKVTLYPGTMTAINRVFGENEEESEGEILSVEFIGKKKTPELAVLVNRDGADIKVDGEFKGVAPLVISDLSEGDHKIEVSAEGYQSRKVTVKLIKNYRLTANIDLAKKTEFKKENLTPTPTKTKEKITPTPLEEKENESTESAKKFEKGSKIVISETETGWLRVRLEPSLSGSEAAKVNPGDEFTVLDEENGWVKIEYEEGKEGWVSGNYVSLK